LLQSSTIWLTMPLSDYPSTWSVKKLPMHKGATNKSSYFREATRLWTRPSSWPWVMGRLWVSCSWVLAAIQQGCEHGSRGIPIIGSRNLAMPSEDTKALKFEVVICKVNRLVTAL
jgi:hypothetical protein